MPLQGAIMGGQHVKPAGGASQPSAKKLCVQSADERELSLQGGEQHAEISGDVRQHSHELQSQDAVEGEESPQLTTDPESLTDTVNSGIYMMQTRKKAVETKVQCPTALVSIHVPHC